MDAVLERVLSLIPKNENGEYKRGAKKAFADSIGVQQQTISDWIGERSSSYMDKLHEIAEVNHVSVAWLKTGITANEAYEQDRQQWLEELEALQILRDKPATRTLLMASKKLTNQQIEKMADWISSFKED